MHKRAGKKAKPEDLLNLADLLNAYKEIKPDPQDPQQRVVFGTSGHRGQAQNGSFNENHIRAISAAIAEYREREEITGPLFIGADTHALSEPALETAVAVLIDRGVQVFRSAPGDYTPTPAISHAILSYNSAGNEDLADGIVVTPSHNPPGDGGIKYNETHGGPADAAATDWIAARANEILESKTEVLEASNENVWATIYDFKNPYVDSLLEVINTEAIRKSRIKIAAHPLGGAGHAYWRLIAKKYDLDIEVLGPEVDKQWSFMTLDWDGKIRMDPSSKNAMRVVAKEKTKYDLVLANDADADRFGVITKTGGLINPNHMLAVAVDYLLKTRSKDWPEPVGIGKTLVSSALIDRIVADHYGVLLEVPVGFKWFVEGLKSGALSFGGEESAGASFAKFDGTVWTTDKDGLLMCLLAAEITAVTGLSIDEYYKELTAKYGSPAYTRVDAAATLAQKEKLKRLTSAAVTDTELAGETITRVLTHAPGNEESIGGLKVETGSAWFAARPSGTEDVMKIYAESFKGEKHLKEVLKAAEALVAAALEVE